MWGCITAHGIENFCKIEGTMNAELYTEILAEELLNTLELFHIKDEVIFQQDNDPKHTSRLASNWFLENGMTVLQWPAHLLTSTQLKTYGNN